VSAKSKIFLEVRSVGQRTQPPGKEVSANVEWQGGPEGLGL
jgi:hypothetical protein